MLADVLLLALAVLAAVLLSGLVWLCAWLAR
jgi:hypothetical protein